MNLSLVSEDDRGVCLANQGDLTLDQTKPGDDLMAKVAGPDVYGRRVYLDLERTTFIDSAGVGWMIMCHKRFVERGGGLVLHSLPPIVSQVLQLLRLDTILTLAKDLNEAKKIAPPKSTKSRRKPSR